MTAPPPQLPAGRTVRVIVRPLRPGEGEERLLWRHDGDYAIYDVTEPPTPEAGYFAAEDAGELVGYCCFGAEARPPSKSR